MNVAAQNAILEATTVLALVPRISQKWPSSVDRTSQKQGLKTLSDRNTGGDNHYQIQCNSW